MCGKSGQVKFDLGESILQLLIRMGEWGSILSIYTAILLKYQSLSYSALPKNTEQNELNW